MKFLSLINYYRADLRGMIGSIIMLIFSLIAFLKLQSTGYLFYALLGLRDIAASWFLFSRKQALKKSFGWKDALAYISSAFPFLYFTNFTSKLSSAPVFAEVLSIIGFTISTLALFELGKSFGVAPANRGYVKSGVYKVLNHPMYIGYLIAEFGFVLLDGKNIFLFLISLLFYVSRARLENKILSMQSVGHGQGYKSSQALSNLGNVPGKSLTFSW